MAKPKKEPEEESAESFAPPGALVSSTAPVEVVNLEDEIEKAAAPVGAQEVTFWFGNGPQVFRFSDGREFHVKHRTVSLADPQLIADFKKLAENSANRIFIQ